jgi:hypothetical protein
VPQIWLTYNELSDLIGSDAATARATAHAMPLDRRKSRDGHTRVKLNARLTEMFLDRLAQHWTDHNNGVCATELRDMRQRMARSSCPSNCAPTSIAS